MRIQIIDSCPQGTMQRRLVFKVRAHGLTPSPARRAGRPFFLLYLNDQTFVGRTGEELAKEVCAPQESKQVGAGMGEHSLHIKACHSIPSMAHHVGSMFECLSGLHGTGAHRAQVMQVLEGKTHNILLLHENCKERGGCEFARCVWQHPRAACSRTVRHVRFPRHSIHMARLIVHMTSADDKYDLSVLHT